MAFDGEALATALEERLGTLTEITFARQVNDWWQDEAANAEALDLAAPGVASTVSSYGSETEIRIPGTSILVSVFFAAFVLYYFVNWKYLSELWPLS